MSDPGRGEDEMTWRPIEDAVFLFVVEAKEHGLGPDASFQDVIDVFGDHNQAMLNAVETASPGLYAAVEELMADENDESMAAAIAIMNVCFNMAKAIWEAQGR